MKYFLLIGSAKNLEVLCYFIIKILSILSVTKLKYSIAIIIKNFIQ